MTSDQPGFTPQQVVRGLSLARRVGYVVAGLGGLAVALLVGLLWATEPGVLPVRTRVAFAGVVGAGLGWAAFAGWALGRRPLFAVDRVVGATLAVGFSTATTAAMVTLAATRSGPAAAAGALLAGSVLVAVATAALLRARSYRARLLARTRDLATGPRRRPQEQGQPERAVDGGRHPHAAGPPAQEETP